MTDFILHFVFFHQEHFPFDETVQQTIRREVATILETCHFGSVFEENNHFWNTYATPTTDAYDSRVGENVLLIFYGWRMPLVHGDVGKLVNEGIPRLNEFIANNFEDFRVVIQLQYELL